MRKPENPYPFLFCPNIRAAGIPRFPHTNRVAKNDKPRHKRQSKTQQRQGNALSFPFDDTPLIGKPCHANKRTIRISVRPHPPHIEPQPITTKPESTGFRHAANPDDDHLHSDCQYSPRPVLDFFSFQHHFPLAASKTRAIYRLKIG